MFGVPSALKTAIGWSNGIIVSSIRRTRSLCMQEPVHPVSIIPMMSAFCPFSGLVRIRGMSSCLCPPRPRVTEKTFGPMRCIGMAFICFVSVALELSSVFVDEMELSTTASLEGGLKLQPRCSCESDAVSSFSRFSATYTSSIGSGPRSRATVPQGIENPDHNRRVRTRCWLLPDRLSPAGNQRSPQGPP